MFVFHTVTVEYKENNQEEKNTRLKKTQETTDILVMPRHFKIASVMFFFICLKIKHEGKLTDG